MNINPCLICTDLHIIKAHLISFHKDFSGHYTQCIKQEIEKSYSIYLPNFCKETYMLISKAKPKNHLFYESEFKAILFISIMDNLIDSDLSVQTSNIYFKMYIQKAQTWFIRNGLEANTDVRKGLLLKAAKGKTK